MLPLSLEANMVFSHNPTDVPMNKEHQIGSYSKHKMIILLMVLIWSGVCLPSSL